jgi:hypothetical protein
MAMARKQAKRKQKLSNLKVKDLDQPGATGAESTGVQGGTGRLNQPKTALSYVLSDSMISGY